MPSGTERGQTSHKIDTALQIGNVHFENLAGVAPD